MTRSHSRRPATSENIGSSGPGSRRYLRKVAGKSRCGTTGVPVTVRLATWVPSSAATRTAITPPSDRPHRCIGAVCTAAISATAWAVPETVNGPVDRPNPGRSGARTCQPADRSRMTGCHMRLARPEPCSKTMARSVTLPACRTCIVTPPILAGSGPDANPSGARTRITTPGCCGHTVVVTGEDWRAPSVLLQILREEAGLDLATLAPTSVGESRAAFWVTGRDGTVGLLKIMPGSSAGLVAQLRALEAMTARLRDRDYPAPRITALGRTAAFAFWIQQRLPGRPLDLRPGFPDLARLGALLPEIIRLNDAQAGLGTGTTDWPALLIRTLTEGADGYCVHATLAARPDTRDMLRVVRE